MAPILHPPSGHILYNLTWQFLPLQGSDISLPLTLGMAMRLALVIEMLEGQMTALHFPDLARLEFQLC